VTSIEERAAEWIRGDDTGISSKQIWKVMTGQFLHDESPYDYGRTPSDPSDLGRCQRLLTFIPEWRLRLGEVARAYPTWAPLVREWDRLVELYDRAFTRPNRSAWECFNLMHELAVEAGVLKSFAPLPEPASYEVPKGKGRRRRRGKLNPLGLR
jgi:hypothetical protein